jgi:autotransporter-associated beta strand protein
MKPKYQIACRLALVSAIAFTASAHAANLTWDTVAGDGASITANGGNWDTSTVTWNDAGADVAWSQTSATASLHAAIFGGADGTYAIDVPVGIAARSLTFNNSGYTLSAGGTRTVTLNPSALNGAVSVTLAAGKTATIGTNVSVSGSSGSPLTVAGAGTLSITGTGARLLSTSNNLTLSSGPIVEVGTGGTLSTNAQLIVGSSTSSNLLNVNGGTVSAGATGSTGANQQNIVLFNATTAGAAELTISNGGSVTNLGTGRVSSTGNPVGSGESGLRFGSTTSTTNAVSTTVNLNGGTLTVARVYEGNTGIGLTSTFNFNGGTLKVTAGAGNAANFMTGLDSANVLSGGAKIDTNGVDGTIAQALLDGSGGGGLTKEGNGILTLAGANTYTGATIINGGKLNLNAPYNAITATTINSGARLRVTTGTSASSIPSVTVNTGGGFEVNTGNYNASQLAGISTPTFNNNDNYMVDLTGENIVPGDITVLTYTNKTGTGTPSLGSLPPGVTATISDTGSAIVIDVDTPQVPSIIWSAGTGNWDTVTANWTGATYTEGAVVTFPEIAGDNIVTLTAARSPFSVAISNNTTSTYTFDGAAISGSASVAKTGTGAASFDVANSYTGTTSISSGGILVNADGALGTTAAGTTIASGASLGLANGTSYATAEPVSGSGAGIVTGFGDFTAGSRGFIQSISGSSTFAGPVKLNANGTSRIGVQDNSQLTLSGPITMADGVTTAAVLFRAGATDGDFITLSNSGNSWGGGTQIFSTNDGSTGIVGVRLGVDNGLPVTTTLSGGGVSTGNGTTLDLAGYDQTLDGLVNSNSRLHISNSSASLSTLTLNPSQDRSSVSDGSNPTTLIEDGAGSGTVALVKTGTFSQTLHGANTYSGSTTINGGTLALSATGTIDNTGTMTIAAGATFDVSAKATYAIPPSMPVTFKLDPAAAGSAGRIKAAADLDISSAAITLDPVATLDDPVYILAEYTNLTGTLQFGSVIGLPSGYSIKYDHNGGTQIALVADGFASWAGGFGLAPADQDPTDDPDNDGMENLLEFVLNGDPSVSDGTILPVLAVTSSDFEFTYQRRDDSVAPETTQTFEWGSTLAAWPGSAVIPPTSNTVGVATITVSAGTPSDAVTDTVKVSIPKTEAGGAGKLFGRLMVEKP